MKSLSHLTALGIQSFVETVGTSIKSGEDLSEPVEMPSFSIPLTSGAEIADSLTMRVDSSDSDTLAMGHLGMDLSMHDSHVFGMSVSALESEQSEDIAEEHGYGAILFGIQARRFGCACMFQP